ncbi:MAG: protein translocase subunit SecF [Leptospiraceae bacterium]|nr:protein translocase subunit SecF [Leptospiraceae bacterium]MCP5511719.1 protein translocase subunit SecF [Leptospiraceae bacterium]
MVNFSKFKYISLSSSILIILLGFIITFAINKGFAHSLDFNGGLRTVIEAPSDKQRESIQKFFTDEGIDSVIILLDKEKNHYQIDVGLDAEKKIINYNLKASGGAERNNKPIIEEYITMLKNGLNLTDESILSADQVGAIVGKELTSTGISLLLYTLFIMAIYLSFRFEFKFALGASAALIHDLLISLAFMGAFQIKPSVPIIAALLTILGYSINDTIVIFDRIRENLSGKVERSFSEVINISINQTLGRTINTSVATLISVLAIVIGGAVELYDFAYVLIFGVVIGTYSSIFIAAPIIEIYEGFFPKKA